MVIYEPTLLNLPDEMPLVDFEEHKTRYRTLQAIARQYAANPERFGIVKVWRHTAYRVPAETGLQTKLSVSTETWAARVLSERGRP